MLKSHLSKYDKIIIINISTIRRYSDEFPKILMYNNEINKNHFKIKVKTLI